MFCGGARAVARPFEVSFVRFPPDFLCKYRPGKGKKASFLTKISIFFEQTIAVLKFSATFAAQNS
jgi:hypothetical protein